MQELRMRLHVQLIDVGRFWAVVAGSAACLRQVFLMQRTYNHLSHGHGYKWRA